jgi:hypothetical protein
MSNIEIGNKDNLRVVRTIREKNYQKYSLSAEDRNKNYLVTQTIKPNQDFFSSMLLLQNNRSGEIKHATSRRMFVQYGEEINYPENEWKQLLAYEVYQGSKNDLYTWAMYLVPKDAIEGERFYVEDVIDDIVVQRFWDSIIRAKDGVGIWNGINLEIDENCYKDTYVIG